MDLSSLKPTSDSVWIILKHPVTNVELADENGPVRINIFGTDSEVFKTRRRHMAQMAMEAQMKRKTIQAAQVEEETQKMLIACVAGWENISLSGKALAFSPSNVKLLFEELPWVQAQLDEEIGTIGNFIKTSPTS